MFQHTTGLLLISTFLRTNQYTFTVGGGLFLGTPKYKGFSLAIEPMGESGLGTHASNPNLVSRTIGPSFSTLGQAYIQYKRFGIDAKIGDVELNHTPWDGSNVGYRVLPITYQGLSFEYSNGKGLKLYADRMFKWRYYNQEHYNRETVYSEYLPETRKNSGGLLNVGIIYKGSIMNSNYIKTNNELWFYNFYQYDRLYMLQSINTFGKGLFKGVLGFQFMHAGKNDGFLGKVDSQLYGAEIGAKNNLGKVVLEYDFLPDHPNSFNYGGLATPYDTLTDSGPIFAQSILSSTQDFGSGTATGVKADYYGMKNLFIQARYTHLHMRTTPIFKNYNEYNLLLSYSFSSVKGLSLADIASYANENPSSRPNFYQNRLMLVYKF